MIIPYKTDALTIAGNGRAWKVFLTFSGDDGTLLVTDTVMYKGSQAQCKAYVDGWMAAEEAADEVSGQPLA